MYFPVNYVLSKLIVIMETLDTFIELKLHFLQIIASIIEYNVQKPFNWLKYTVPSKSIGTVRRIPFFFPVWFWTNLNTGW